MRVIYYTSSCFLDFAIPLVEELSRLERVHLVINMSPNNYQGTIVNINPKNSEDKIYNAKEYFADSLPLEIYQALENLEGFWVVNHRHKNFQHPRAWPMIWKEVAFLNSLDADILHMDSVSPSIARLIFLIKSKIVCTIHDAKAHSGEKNWRSLLWRKITFPFVKKFVVHSQYSSYMLQKAHNIKAEMIAAVPLGIYRTYQIWKNNIDPKNNNILFFGRLSPYKGIDVLIEAMKLVSEKKAGVCLTIAGEPVPSFNLPDLPDLENNCNINIISRYIPTDELCNLIQEASFCLLPYKDASQSGVILTSFVLNTPVIASNVGGLPEYIREGETGLLVPPNDPIKLSEAIIFLLKNDSILQRMKKNIMEGKTGISTWDEIAKRLFKEYERVLNM